MRETIRICEVGPRDGLQMARSTMQTHDKKLWVASIAAAGIREIEVGSFVSPRLIPAMADTGDIVRYMRATLPQVTAVALVPNLRGAMDAVAAGTQRISIPVSVSEAHSRANLNRTPLEQVAEVGKIVSWMRTHAPEVEVEAACSTAFGCSIGGHVPERDVTAVAAALMEAGVHAVGLADTVGYAHPAQIRSTVRAVRSAIGDGLDGLHLHDTMGLGIANALAGLDEGIRSFDAAMGGLGGCPFAPGASGNIVTEDLVFMLESMGLDTGIDLAKLIEARAVLHAGLPDEPLHGQVAKAGIPKTYSGGRA